MRYLLELPDARTNAAIAGIAQATTNLAECLTGCTAETLCLGMQHQLGVVSALTMDKQEDHSEEIATHLLGLSGMAALYLKALYAKGQDVTDEQDGQEGTASGDGSPELLP